MVLTEIGVSILTTVLTLAVAYMLMQREQEIAVKKDEEKNDDTVRKYFECGITHEIMSDPCLASDGHTYERSALEQWFAAGHRTSPITRQQLDTKVIPNLALRGQIEEYRKREGLPVIQLPPPGPINFDPESRQEEEEAPRPDEERPSRPEQQRRTVQRATVQMAPDTANRVAASLNAIISATPDRAAALGIRGNDLAAATRLVLGRPDILSGLTDAANSVPRLQHHATMLSRVGEQQTTLMRRIQREQRRVRDMARNVDTGVIDSTTRWPRILRALREDDVQSLSMVLTEESDAVIRDQFEEDESLGHYATRFDAVECLEWILKERSTAINPKSKLDGVTMAHIAAMYDARECLAVLIAFGHSIDDRAIGVPPHLAALCHQIEQRPLSLSSTRPTHVACVAKTNTSREAVWQFLFLHGADFTARDDMGSTPLHCAASAADYNAIQFALEKIPQLVDSLDSGRHTPLHRICSTRSNFARAGAAKCVESLLRAGADPNAINASGLAPLHIAAANSNPFCAHTADKLCSALCSFSTSSKHIQVNIKSVQPPSQTPLHIAAINNKLAVVRTLISFGASVSSTDSMLRTPLHLVAAASNLRISLAVIQELYAKCASPSQAQDAIGRTPLQTAAAVDNALVLQALITLGLGCDGSTTRESALHIAAQHNSLRCAEILLDNNWPVDIRAKFDQSTPLHRCAGRGLVAMASLLLSRGADPKAQSESGATVIDFAKSVRDTRMLALLNRTTHHQEQPPRLSTADSVSPQRQAGTNPNESILLSSIETTENSSPPPITTMMNNDSSENNVIPQVPFVGNGL